jgi:hypothetical protein
MSGAANTYYTVASLPDTNARQPAMPIRAPSTALLTVDSEDRFQDYTAARNTFLGSPYSYTITKSESLMSGFFTRIGLTELVLPWTIPNINRKTDQIQVVTQVGVGAPVTTVITLPQGFNTPSQLATLLNAKIQPILATFSIVYGTTGVGGTLSLTPNFTYSSGAPGTNVSFLPMVPNSAAYPFPPNTKQLFDILGFYSANSIPLANNTGGTTFCQFTRYVDVVCNQLTNAQALKDASTQTVVRDSICRFYLSSDGSNQTTVPCNAAAFSPPCCTPGTFYRQYALPKQIQWVPNQNIPGYLRFDLYDDVGNLLSESDPFGNTNRTDWSMTLQVSEV